MSSVPHLGQRWRRLIFALSLIRWKRFHLISANESILANYGQITNQKCQLYPFFNNTSKIQFNKVHYKAIRTNLLLFVNLFVIFVIAWLSSFLAEREVTGDCFVSLCLFESYKSWNSLRLQMGYGIVSDFCRPLSMASRHCWFCLHSDSIRTSLPALSKQAFGADFACISVLYDLLPEAWGFEPFSATGCITPHNLSLNIEGYK